MVRRENQAQGLREPHERDVAVQLPASLVPWLRRILFRLQETHPNGVAAPGVRLHLLKGDRTGQWGTCVSGNWRMVFRFEDGEAVEADLIDCH